jgi:hypothetical protein
MFKAPEAPASAMPYFFDKSANIEFPVGIKWERPAF